VNYLAAEMMAGEETLVPESDMDAMAKRAERMEVEGGAAGETVGQKRKFVPASATAAGTGTGAAPTAGLGSSTVDAIDQQAAKIRATLASRNHNPEELNIDGDGEEEETGFGVVQRPVPAAVFGSAAAAAAAGKGKEGGEKIGALQRLMG